LAIIARFLQATGQYFLGVILYPGGGVHSIANHGILYAATAPNDPVHYRSSVDTDTNPQRPLVA